jgi:periplasmic divalent cation tolerance protein
MTDRDVLLALCTVPDAESGAKLAGLLLEQRLAACVNVVPGLISIYRWEGKVEQDPEALMVIKTTRGAFEALREMLAEAHPYDVPEIIAARIDEGLGAYLDWVRDECSPGSESR